MLKKLTQLNPVVVADAHCDIPCGIYDPRDAVQAAQTVIRMTELIGETKNDGSTAALNSLTRYIAVKEEHAAKAKHDIVVIWTDYFKPHHLEQHPELHSMVWEACRLGSHVKQNVDMDKALEFKAALERIAEVFWATKKG